MSCHKNKPTTDELWISPGYHLCTDDLWHQKTRVPELSRSFVCVIVCLAVLVEHRLVTDRHRHRRTQAHDYYRGCMASRGINQLNLVATATSLALRDRKTGFRSIVYCRSSTNPADLAKIGQDWCNYVCR